MFFLNLEIYNILIKKLEESEREEVEVNKASVKINAGESYSNGLKTKSDGKCCK